MFDFLKKLGFYSSSEHSESRSSRQARTIKVLIFILIIIGVFLRFYNLNWGAPFYFHPDERQNVVYPVLESKSIFMLDQKNFDTGTFPLIVIKIIYTPIKHFLPGIDPTQTVILISRGLSALISIAISWLLFLTVKKIFGAKQAFFALILSTFSTGLIQFAHFGTIELWEALFFLCLFYYAWQLSKYARVRDSIISGVILGIAISTKVLSLILTPAIFVSFVIFSYHRYKSKTKFAKSLQKSVIGLCVFGITALFVFGITSIPLLTNFSDSQRSIKFESDVALGKLPVFYTQGFFDTVPVLFQFTKVYPFLLNPVVSVAFLISLIYVIIYGLKKKNYSYLLVSTFFLLLFVSQSFFFVKWARYMVPTLPFVYIIISIAFGDLWQFATRNKRYKPTAYLLIGSSIFASCFFVAAFFITTYLKTPTPVAAASFAAENMDSSSRIVTEPFDLGITPFNSRFPNITFFNFYELDNNTTEFSEQKLKQHLDSSNYIILPSQRLLKSRMMNESRFPKGNGFYTKLTSGELGYTKIYETPCDFFCKMIYLNAPVFGLEETTNVFDQPTVFIFKKTN